MLLSYRITREVNPGLANFRNLAEQQFLLGAIGGLSGKHISDTLIDKFKFQITRLNNGIDFILVALQFSAAQKTPNVPL